MLEWVSEWPCEYECEWALEPYPSDDTELQEDEDNEAGGAPSAEPEPPVGR